MARPSCHRCLGLALLVASLAMNGSFALLQPTHKSQHTGAAHLLGRHRTTTTALFEQYKKEGLFDFIFNPYESKIPEEIKKEIYEAEGNTQAAKDRGARIGVYALVAFTGVAMAFFNGFLTEMRSGPTPDGVPFDLDQSTFAWVNSNFLFQFFFLNKIGGGLALLTGAGAGLLAEAEYDTRRINAEKIWEEMQRRRGNAEKRKQPKSSRKKRRSGKEAKRISALSEVVLDEERSQATSEPAAVEEQVSPAEPEKTQDGGILGTLKGFYEKADSMSASQALLLNKKLEDEGLIEKITDETGLKVIGREAATKLTRGDEIAESPTDPKTTNETKQNSM